MAGPVGGRGGPLQLDGVASLLVERPLVVALALVLAAVALSALILVRRSRTSMGGRLQSALARTDSVLVLTHPNPDPDAMASALAVGLIAERAGTTATLGYSGEIRHQENRAFETVLDLDLEHVVTAADITADEVVLVDHGAPRGFEGADGVEPYAVVDHHPEGGEGTAFTDVRDDVGACASIVASYLRELGLEPAGVDESTDEDEFPARVATALVCGIQTDTKGFSRGCAELDFEAGAFLHPGVDPDLLDRIANPQVSSEVLDIQSRAISLREVEGSFAVSHVGPISNPDAIPQAADELLRLEGVSAVVVVGEYEGMLHFSGRSRDDRVHMGRTLSAALDDLPRSTAGGHARMGGGQCAADGLNGNLEGALSERVFDALAGHR